VINDGKVKAGMGLQMTMVDYLTKTRRPGTTQDSLRAMALGGSEELKNVEWVTPFVIPSDYPLEIVDVVAYKLIWTYSPKPGGAWIYSAKTARYIIEMAKIVCGGEEELRKKKILGYGAESVSPLRFSPHSLEIMLEMAKYGLPIGNSPMVQAGLSGPVTLAGTLVVENAEVLAGAILVHALNPEQPYHYSFIPHLMDPRTALCSFGSPEQVLMALAGIQLARHYGFACTCNVGLTDSLTPDFQAGFEKAMTAALAVAAGAEGIGSQGIVGADQGASLEQLMMDDEWMGSLSRVFRGFEVNPDTLALDVIRKVGVGGDFLKERHTALHLRKELWIPRIFNRLDWETWIKGGARESSQLAHEKVEKILEDSYPPKAVLDGDTIKNMDNIVKRAKREILKEP